MRCVDRPQRGFRAFLLHLGVKGAGDHVCGTDGAHQFLMLGGVLLQFEHIDVGILRLQSIQNYL